ncbi:hypothetical protein P4544_00865 [Halomonas sp. LY9]
MLMRRFTLLTALFLMCPPLVAAHHGGDHSGEMAGHSSIEVVQPWTRATPPGLAQAVVLSRSLITVRGMKR